jgi:hypothetical protein
MKLYSQRLEILALYTICESDKPKLVRQLVNALDKSYFHFPPSARAYERLGNVYRMKQKMLNWDMLCEDMGIDEDYRDILKARKPKKVLQTRDQVSNLVRSLNHYRKARVLYDMARNIIETLQKPEVNTDELMTKSATRLKRNDNPALPTCYYDPALINESLDMVDRVLSEVADPIIFQHLGKVVTIKHIPEVDEDGEDTGRALSVIREVDERHFSAYLSTVINFEGSSGKKTISKPTPKDLSTTYLSPARTWKLPQLTGIINCPTILSNGSILKTPGYHRSTGIYFDPKGLDFSGIPDNPTEKDAKAALAYILDFLKEFRFRSDLDKSVAIATMCLALARRRLPKAPFTAFSSPKRGSGKTTLMHMIALLLTGNSLIPIRYKEDDDEMEKQVMANLVEGAQFLGVDNVKKGTVIDSDVFCILSTSDRFGGRILTKTKTGAPSSRVTVMFTGKNIKVHEDLNTRVLLCELFPKMEHPERRRYHVQEFEKHVLEHRVELDGALLILMRFYHILPEEKKKPITPSRFPQWSKLLRAPLMHLGMPDPLLSMDKLQGQDLDQEEILGVYFHWYKVCQSDEVTVHRLIEIASDGSHGMLKEEFLNVAGNRDGTINARLLSCRRVGERS